MKYTNVVLAVVAGIVTIEVLAAPAMADIDIGEGNSFSSNGVGSGSIQGISPFGSPTRDISFDGGNIDNIEGLDARLFLVGGL